MREIIALADPGEDSIEGFLENRARHLGHVHEGRDRASVTLFATIADSVEALARSRIIRSRFLADADEVRVGAVRLKVDADTDSGAGLRLLDLRDDASATLPALHAWGWSVGSHEWTCLRALSTESGLAGLLVTDAGGGTAVVMRLDVVRLLLEAGLASIQFEEWIVDPAELLPRSSALARLARLNRHLDAYVREVRQTNAHVSDLVALVRQLVRPGIVTVVVAVAAITHFLG